MPSKKIDIFNPQWERFCRAYMLCGNATQAAREAGYSGKTAGQQGYRLLKNVEILGRLQAMRSEIGDLIGVTPAMVAAELARVGFSDMGKYAKWGKKGVTIQESHDAVGNELVDTRCVQSVTESVTVSPAGSETTKTTIKLHDKRAALADLNKMLGWNASEDNKLTLVVDGLGGLIANARNGQGPGNPAGPILE